MTNEPLDLFCYCDESGNSGLNLFDKDQPFFWLGVLISPIDLNEDPYTNHIMQQLLLKAPGNELHGKEIGLKKLSPFCNGIKKILNHSNCYLQFVKIEKSYLAKLKLFDYLFDSYTNKAVPIYTYNVRAMRLTLAAIFCQQIDDQIAQLFWDTFKKPNENMYKKLLQYIRESIHQDGSRQAELIYDATKWAENHIKDVFPDKQNKFDSPNVIALSQLILNINDAYHGSPVSIKKFYHDKSIPFTKFLEKEYSHTNVIKADYSDLALIDDITYSNINWNDIEFCSSTDQYGIQLIDTILYIVKKLIDQHNLNLPDFNKLIYTIIKRSFINEFSEDSYNTSAMNFYNNLMKYPITDTSYTNFRKYEKERETRMQSSTP